MSDKQALLASTKSFPDSTVITFEGKKTTLAELRSGSPATAGSASPATHSGAKQCPRCKSFAVVTSLDGFTCNACGNTFR